MSFFDSKSVQAPAAPASGPSINRDVSMPTKLEAALPPESLPTATRAESVSLSGRVAREYGDLRVDETVVLHLPSQSMHYSTSTGSSGEFTFSDIKPAMDYVLKISPHGMYKRFSHSPLQLLIDQEMPAIVLEAIPVALLVGNIVGPHEISGTIFDESGLSI